MKLKCDELNLMLAELNLSFFDVNSRGFLSGGSVIKDFGQCAVS